MPEKNKSGEKVAGKNAKSPLKVMHICGSPKRAGTEKVFLRFVTAQRRDETYSVMPVVAQGSWLEKNLRERGIPHESVKFPQGVSGLLARLFGGKTKKNLEEIINNHKPDIIQNWAGPSSMFIPKTRCPQVARVGLSMPPKYTRNARLIACATQSVCDHLRHKGVPPEKLRHIPTLINIPPKGFEDFRYDVRAEYSIPHEAHVVLLLGRLQEDKGFDVALFALNMLPENIHALIVGEGPEHAGLEDAVEADNLHGRVHFSGWIDNLTPIFAAADSFLLPSRRQSSCNVILEAWAHRLPVVATEIESVRALATHDETAVLIPAEDEVAIAKEVGKLAADPRRATALAKAGHKYVREVFSEPAILQAYDTLYRDALTGHNPAEDSTK